MVSVILLTNVTTTTNLIQSIEPVGTFVVPVHTTRVLWPSSTLGDVGETVSLSRVGHEGLGRTVITATRSAEPTAFDAIHLKTSFLINKNLVTISEICT